MGRDPVVPNMDSCRTAVGISTAFSLSDRFGSTRKSQTDCAAVGEPPACANSNDVEPSSPHGSNDRHRPAARFDVRQIARQQMTVDSRRSRGAA